MSSGNRKTSFGFNKGGDGGLSKFQNQSGNRGGQSSNQGGGKPTHSVWYCLECNNDNFVHRTECKKCNAPKGNAEIIYADGKEPRQNQRGGQDKRGGQQNKIGGQKNPKELTHSVWYCPECNNDNFHHRTQCNKCHAPKGNAEIIYAPGHEPRQFQNRGGAHNKPAGFQNRQAPPAEIPKPSFNGPKLDHPFHVLFTLQETDESGNKFYSCNVCQASHLPELNMISHKTGRKHLNRIKELEDTLTGRTKEEREEEFKSENKIYFLYKFFIFYSNFFSSSHPKVPQAHHAIQ
jgi:hypothetical protein